METERIKEKLDARFPGAITLIPNGSAANQPSLAIPPDQALAIARFLRDDPECSFDYCSSVTGVDWLDAVAKEKIKVKKLVEGVEKEVEETVERKRPGYLEVVYHLYSMKQRTGPLIFRQRTGNRTDNARVTSLTPIWRGCEFQEREVYDLYGVQFDGHPDLRRILMWDGFKDYPMRKDYRPPDDFEWEPTPHDEVLVKARQHYPAQT